MYKNLIKMSLLIPGVIIVLIISLPILYGYPSFFYLISFLKILSFVAIMTFTVWLMHEFRVHLFISIVAGILFAGFLYFLLPGEKLDMCISRVLKKDVIHYPMEYERDEQWICRSDRYEPEKPALFPIIDRKSQKMGYIDKTGKVVIKPEFAYADDFYEGLARVNFGGQRLAKGGLYDNSDILYGNYGYIDTKGKIVIKLLYSDAGRFSEGLAAVRKGTKYGYINKKGVFVIKPHFLCAGEFKNGQASVCVDKNAKPKLNFIQPNSSRRLIDKSGRFILENIFYDKIHNFSEDLAIVEKYGKMGVINTNGKQVIDIKYDYISDFKEGLAVVKIGKKYGYIDKEGTIIIKPRFISACNFSEGVANVDEFGIKKRKFILGKGDIAKDYINEKWGYIDKTGKYVIIPKYKRAYAFKNGLAPVYINEKWKYIDNTGIYKYPERKKLVVIHR